MKKKEVIKNAFINSLGTAIYIVVLVFLISSLDGSVIDGEKETLLTPIFILTLFIFSATLTGFLVLGRPILWYWDGKKKDAIRLFSYTLVILFVVIVFMLFLMLSEFFI